MPRIVWPNRSLGRSSGLHKKIKAWSSLPLRSCHLSHWNSPFPACARRYSDRSEGLRFSCGSLLLWSRFNNSQKRTFGHSMSSHVGSHVLSDPHQYKQDELYGHDQSVDTSVSNKRDGVVMKVVLRRWGSPWGALSGSWVEELVAQRKRNLIWTSLIASCCSGPRCSDLQIFFKRPHRKWLTK